MGNKLDIILNKLIKEELGNYDVTNYGEEFEILNDKEETFMFLKDLINQLKTYIKNNLDNKDESFKRVINLYSLVKDVLSDYDFVYDNNLSTISKIILNSKKLNLI